ncbi:5'-deoxynucleotidase [Corallincola spongiicola]|uniref:5'-deoxynucleotidase n=1 Tax=Corallincola spongiicola TaxID=2520508 RepID=A0ABY1WLP6_9GAMM|nr:5'-deoxynucleotidase [Corallincola spongiicola]TAA41849.1 5'-deoxynucleotidase [Corallincola spongiicola]
MRNVFFALMSRMQNIQRWSKSNPTRSENVAEHSLQVAMFAHCLGVIRNTVYTDRPKVNEDKLATLALFHDGPEVLTEDVNSLIKYSDNRMLNLCREMEHIACDMMVNTVPEEMADIYRPLIQQHEQGSEEGLFVKAADILSAYAKALSELRANNTEFKGTKEKLDKVLADYCERLPEVGYFMEKFMPSFMLTIDDLVDAAFMPSDGEQQALHRRRVI